MTRYKEYFERMISENKDAFEGFRTLHDNYALNPEKWQENYNREGEKILEIVREYENRLCANTERGAFNKYSTNLSEKFQNEVRNQFPMIGHIGLTIEKNSKTDKSDFVLKKIDLH